MRYIKLDTKLFEQLETLELKSHHHKGFVLGYMCAVQIVWMDGDYYKKQIALKDILKMLGLSKTNPSFSYLIKKGGLLEQHGIIAPTKDFPVNSVLSERPVNFSELSKEEQKAFMQKVGKMSFKKPEYLYKKSCDGITLIDRETDYFTITEKEFEECITRGGTSLLLFFAFIKCRQVLAKKKSVVITHDVFKQHLGFSTQKITGLTKELQYSPIVHLSRQSELKNGIMRRTNRFFVLSALKNADKNKLMNQPKEKQGFEQI